MTLLDKINYEVNLLNAAVKTEDVEPAFLVQLAERVKLATKKYIEYQQARES